MVQLGRWVSIGPSVIRGGIDAVGRLSAIAIDPDDSEVMYVGARGCGVWKTSDGGLNWSAVADSLPSLAVAAITIDPSNSQRLYVGLEDFENEDLGVFTSLDAGGTWQQLSSDIGMRVRFGKIIIHPGQPNILYATSRQGVQRSDDGGSTWGISLNLNAEATDLVMDSRAPDTLYASGADGVFKTTNGGAFAPGSWTQLTSGLPSPGHQHITMTQCLRQPSTLYAAYRFGGADVRFRLFRTEDAGATWTERFSTTDSGFFNDVMAVDPDDANVVYATGRWFHRSGDGGQTFVKSDGPHADQHDIATHPRSPGVIFTACDGGLYRSSDRAKPGTWQFVSEGLSNVEFYETATASSDRSVVIGGTQDNGLCTYRGSGTIWDQKQGGDVMGVAIDPRDADLMYSVGLGMQDMFRNNGGGDAPWKRVTADQLSGCSPWSREFRGEPSNHVIVHPGDPSTLLATCVSLWRGPDWQAILTPNVGDVSRVAVEPSSDLYLAGTSAGQIFGGLAGDFAAPPVTLRPRRVLDIKFDSNVPTTAYACVDASSGDRVYRVRTTPGGVQLQADPISDGLPMNEKVLTLAVDQLRPFTVYVGTRRGVFRGTSSDGDAPWIWSDYNDGLPRAHIASLTVQPQTGLLRVGTYGRGAYEVETDTLIGAIGVAEGVPSFLRAHSVGGGFGPPLDQIDVEAVVRLDTSPTRAFGVKLRRDTTSSSHLQMFNLLRDAFREDHRVRIEFVRTGLNNGEIIRVARAA